ncbi:hypothetical protein OIB37_21205 [Streptomyces sp. NBC_00820]|uniref:hypothetical protein n=1 Tax=Streptomyces sp. NBC_00820 TaxID=2975842 RepID=UPI002ED2D385|nr:hypothetical protein OIB37_21205 [Streptomyces sp. NBC_00820]
MTGVRIGRSERVGRLRAWVLVGGWCGVAALGAGGPAWADAGPQADLAFHGSATMSGDHVEVRLTPRNNGPSTVPDASVLLRWSVPLAERQELPQGCARTDERTVVCGTGALAVGGVGEQIRVAVALRDRPSEVTLEVDTAWNGGVVDPDRANDTMRVLVLDTGDAYSF